MRNSTRSLVLVGLLVLASLLAGAAIVVEDGIHAEFDDITCSGTDLDCESRPEHHHGH